MRRLVLLLALAASILGATLVAEQPAGATAWVSTDWIAGKSVGDWYNATHSAGATEGVWFVGQNGHTYLGLPAHLLEQGNNVCRGCAPFYSRYEWVNGINDRYDLFDVKWAPPNAPNVDFALLDMGLSSSIPAQIASNDLVWNYCDPGRGDVARCSSWLPGGFADNANGVGSTYENMGWATPSTGMFVCKSGAFSGTSCGTITGVAVNNVHGYSYTDYLVEGLDRCKVVGGDSGAPVFSDYGGGHAVIVGVLTGASTDLVGTESGCYKGGTTYGSAFGFIGIDQINAWFGPWTGGSIVPMV